MIIRESKLTELNKLNNKHNEPSENRLLCFHCKRTKANGFSCIGKCVADNEYWANS